MAAAVLVVAMSAHPARAREPALAEAVPAAAPGTWRELPMLAEKATSAALALWPDIALRVRAAGDPAMGCFLLVAEAEVQAADAGVHEALGKALERAGMTTSQAQTSPPPGSLSTTGRTVSALALETDPFRGRAVLVSSPMSGSSPHDAIAIRLAACFYSQREPELSARLCEKILREFEAEP